MSCKGRVGSNNSRGVKKETYKEWQGRSYKKKKKKVRKGSSKEREGKRKCEGEREV